MKENIFHLTTKDKFVISCIDLLIVFGYVGVLVFISRDRGGGRQHVVSEGGVGREGGGRQMRDVWPWMEGYRLTMAICQTDGLSLTEGPRLIILNFVKVFVLSLSCKEKKRMDDIIAKHQQF